MAKHKIARKVAGNSDRHVSGKINIFDWLQEAYPEVYEQYKAVKDIERSVEFDDLKMHRDLHEQFLEQYKIWKGK